MKISHDQFYTNPKISDKLSIKIYEKILQLGHIPSNFKWLEPSAGTGNFIHSLKKIDLSLEVIGYDLKPKSNDIIKANFLNFEVPASWNKNYTIVFGNPPFGNRGKLATDFINRASEFSNIIAFILPKQFHRFLTQKNINEKMGLMYESALPPESFIANDKPYDVNCIFQIWINKKKYPIFKDYRKYKQLKQNHNEFNAFIHNNTKNTLKYFDKNKYNWDFAVHRQGFYDYNNLITNPLKLIKNRQYIFVKAFSKKSLSILKNINYQKLSLSNTQTPGFSKTDLIKEYTNLKRQISKKKGNNEIISNTQQY